MKFNVVEIDLFLISTFHQQNETLRGPLDLKHGERLHTNRKQEIYNSATKAIIINDLAMVLSI